MIPWDHGTPHQALKPSVVSVDLEPRGSDPLCIRVLMVNAVLIIAHNELAQFSNVLPARFNRQETLI